jgi:hypothetical protein
MAREVLVIHRCNLCREVIESEDDIRSVVFIVDGVGHELELCPSDFNRFSEAVREFSAVSEPYTPRANGKSSDRRSPETNRTSALAEGLDPNEVRAWARDNGFEVNDVGRIKQEVIVAYRDAHPSVSPV